MKSVLISIKPKYCEMIANGKKTIEVRKTRPEFVTAFKCYIYCTEGKYKGKYLHTSNKNGRLLFWHNKGDCKIICQPEDTSYTAYTCNGKVIGEFVCDEILCFPYVEGEEAGKYVYNIPTVIGEQTCLDYGDVSNYGNGKSLYFWHISDLVIYDEPEELSKFTNRSSPFTFNKDGVLVYKGMTRPPQSWCYVDEQMTQEKSDDITLEELQELLDDRSFDDE